MSAVKLPHAIEEKLGELSQRVRKLWFYRGVSWFALAFFGSALGLVLLEANWELPGYGRVLLLLGWTVAMVIAFRRLVVRPLRSPIPVPLLASAIEGQFPNLSERLTTLVELSENAEAGNGSKALIDVLAKDTAQRAKKLNFQKAAPTASVLRLAVVAAIVAGAILSPLVLIPGAADRVRRFLAPWAGAKAEAGFRVVCSSKNLVAKRNDAVTLTGFLERLAPESPLPEFASLVYKESDREERKLPMNGDEQAAYTVTRPRVGEGFEYCIEADGARSDWHTVTVVDAVELGEGTTFTVRPPKYAAGLVEEKPHQGLQEFEALQYSKVSFHLTFNHPARSAHFEWKPANPNAQVASDQFFATLNDERTVGTAEWMLIGDGTLKLILAGEQNVRTEIVVATKATLDAPPKFEKVVGVTESIRDVRPGERVPIELLVTDDVKLDKLELHFERNGDPTTRRVLPLPLKNVGTARAEGRYSFDLTDKANEGDAIKFRIRAVDNRSVPEFQKTPQESFYPEKDWSGLRIDSKAKPLAEQDVLAKKDKIKEKLADARKQVAEAGKVVEQVKKEATGQEQLTPNQIAKLDNAKNKEKDAARQLSDLARETAVMPDFQPLANRIKNVEEDALRSADDQLRKAVNEADPALRDKAILESDKQLERAEVKLDELEKHVDRFARNLQDKRKLEELADRQNELARELKENPNNDRVAKDVARKQQELNAELDEVLKNNPELKKAVDDLASERAKDLAAEADRLAEDQKRLDRAAKDQADSARKQAMDAAGKKQKELGEKAEQLRKDTKDDATAIGAESLPKEPFDKANEQIANGNAVEAMTEQEKAARELDRLADALEKAADDRRDPKKAAEQLAKLEDQLRKKAAENKEPNDVERQKREKEQDAVKRATEKLSTPPGDEAAKNAKADALEKLERAKKAAAGDPTQADAAMKDASEALNKLAEKLPGREERLKAAKEELDRLQRDQDAIDKEIQKRTKGLEKKADAATRKDAAEKLADAAKKQTALAEQLEQLDAPGLENRRDRAAEAAKRAAEDLKQGRTQDIAVSQQDAKRRQEQLGQSLDGRKPNDQLADELARKQKAIAEAAAKSDGKPMPNQLQRLQEEQRDVRNELAKLHEPNDAEQLNRTKDAVRKVDEAMRRDDADELKKTSKEAAEELDKLADQLAGAESDRKRAERIAERQEEAAAQAKQRAGKPTTPEQTEAAKESVRRQLDDLNRTRAGEAQEEKKKAADALEKLRKEPNPEKAPKLQKDAADATRALADKMNGGKPAENAKKEPGERGNPDANNEGDTADGQLPSKQDAGTARELAKQERELKGELAKANERGQQGPMATNNQKAEELAKQQRQLADEAKQLADEAVKAGDAQAGPAKEAAKQAQEAADQHEAGAPGRGREAGEKARQQLEQAAKANPDNAAGRKAKALAEKQKELNARADEQDKDAGGNAAQQRKQQGELAKQAGDLADKLEDAANEPGNRNVDGDKLKKAAEKAREAKQQMERAEREDGAGRKRNAEDARRQADKALDEMKNEAGEAAGDSAQPMGDPKEGSKPGENAKQAGKAAKEAEGKMDQAGRELGKKQNDRAQSSMEQAAKKLNDAAKQLGDGKGKAGNSTTPGGNDGSDHSPTTQAELPKDLQQYLGKPWGELSGEVKSKIIQDLQAKYGEDYARVIKLYFESIADRK